MSEEEAKNEKPTRSRGLQFAMFLAIFALIGGSAAVLIPAYAGVPPRPGFSVQLITVMAFFFAVLFIWFGKNLWLGLVAGIVLGFGAAVGVGFIYGAMGALGPPPSQEPPKLSLAEQVRLLNKDLPKFVGDGLRLDRVRLREQQLSYENTAFNVRKSAITEEVVEASNADLAKQLCPSPDFDEFIRSGGVVTYVYSDPDGVELYRLSVDAARCGY